VTEDPDTDPGAEIEADTDVDNEHRDRERPNRRRKRQALPLTDWLAVERTHLANERTLLAYIRTSLALLAAAVTLLKFFTSNGMHMLGYILLPVGVGTLVMGLMKYHETKVRVDGQLSKNQGTR
jgi:putative membrane protein